MIGLGTAAKADHSGIGGETAGSGAGGGEARWEVVGGSRQWRWGCELAGDAVQAPSGPCRGSVGTRVGHSGVGIGLACIPREIWALHR